MIVGTVVAVFILLLVVSFGLSVLTDIVNTIRGRLSGYTRFFFLDGDAFFMLLVLSAAIVLMIVCLFALYICLKTVLQ